ncbi:MAG: hypothetical protein JWR14_3709 [Caballeronia sp.]|jgi:hypothetical protein|nr:hypothetical protein [Caballeronia sp.]
MSGTFSRFSKARIPAAQIVKCCQIGPGIISFRRECGDSSITLPRVCPATKVIFVVLKSHPAWVGLFFIAPVIPGALITGGQASASGL